MFRATLCLSSGEYGGREGTSRPAYRMVIYTRCCIDAFDSPDDELKVARNM